MMDKKLTSYLLGEMSEAEQIRLEEEFFADDEKFQQLCATQDDLLDAYVTRRLPPEESEGFERQSLISPWMRDRARLAGVIAEYAGSTLPTRALTQPAATMPSWWQSFKELVWPGTSIWRIAAMSAMALLVLAGGWLLLGSLRARTELARIRERQANEQRIAQQQQEQAQVASERDRSAQLARDLERERVERERMESEVAKSSRQPSPGNLQTVLSFVLTPQALRGSGEMPKLVIQPGVTSVDLRLNLSELTQYREYHAELQTAEGGILSRWRPQPSRKGDGGTFTIRVPVALLGSDDYLLILRGRASTGDYQMVANYSFRVLRSARN